MKYFIVAGEASGDLHASNLIKEIHKKDIYANIKVWGGDKMQKAGSDLKMHYKELAFMGFWEVFKNLFSIYNKLRLCKQHILDFEPDIIILIDYPGFNLRLASFAKKRGIKIVYYISPKVWVWRSSRVKKIKKCVDRMFVILPFEKTFYDTWNYEVTYVGNPVVDAINDYKGNGIRTDFNLDDRPIIALLPGSRKQEIEYMLPVMLNLISKYKQYQFVVSCMSSQKEVYNKIGDERNIKMIFDDPYGVLKDAKYAIVTSGTATLETALMGVPQVVCYKANWLTFIIGKSLVDIKYISLVNLILDKALVTELIQAECTSDNIGIELDKMINDNIYVKNIEKGYNEIKDILGTERVSLKVADNIIKMLSQ